MLARTTDNTMMSFVYLCVHVHHLCDSQVAGLRHLDVIRP